MISTGTYHPNEAGAKTLKDARPLYVGDKRVSIEVSENEVTLLVGGDIVAVESPDMFDSIASLYQWAQTRSLPSPPPSAVKAGWAVRNATPFPYGRWEVVRPDGHLYGFASSEAGARIMLTRAYQRSIKFNW